MKELLGRQVCVTTTDDRSFTGRLVCIDRDCNIVFYQSIEMPDKYVGTIMISADNMKSMEM